MTRMTFVKQVIATQTGQTLVVLLLILVVTLTVGLSIVSRTITNVKETATTERSSRAFTAAEAGVEAVLRQADLSSVGSQTFNLGTGSTTVTVTKNGGQNGYQPIKPVEKDDAIQLDVDPSHVQSGATAATEVAIYWTRSSDTASENTPCNAASPVGGPAAIEVLVVNSNLVDLYGATRYYYNPSGCGYTANGFATGNTGSAKGFLSKANITLSANANGAPRIMRIRPLYNKATILVEPVLPLGAQLPVQSYKIRSEGVSGDAKRVVEVEKSIGGLPSIFDYVLFNGSASQALTK